MSEKKQIDKSALAACREHGFLRVQCDTCHAEQVLGIVYQTIATHLIKKFGFNKKSARTGSVSLIQRFGSALDVNGITNAVGAWMRRNGPYVVS